MPTILTCCRFDFNISKCAASVSVNPHGLTRPLLHRGRSSKPIFVQIAKQVVNLNPLELRLPSRAWKVKLVGEGADDAGGVFDDTITEMCQVGWTSPRGRGGGGGGSSSAALLHLN